MPSEDTKILEFNQSQKSKKSAAYYLFIYADLECLIKKIDGCKAQKISTMYREVRHA